jgi:hypothetical protein
LERENISLGKEKNLSCNAFFVCSFLFSKTPLTFEINGTPFTTDIPPVEPLRDFNLPVPLSLHHSSVFAKA